MTSLTGQEVTSPHAIAMRPRSASSPFKPIKNLPYKTLNGKQLLFQQRMHAESLSITYPEDIGKTSNDQEIPIFTQFPSITPRGHTYRPEENSFEWGTTLTLGSMRAGQSGGPALAADCRPIFWFYGLQIALTKQIEMFSGNT